MRKCQSGSGDDSTAAVLAYLLAGNEFRIATVYVIGRPDDPMSLWLTDYESPLSWPCWTNNKTAGGFPLAFDPAVIARDTISSVIGLDVQNLNVTWTPKFQQYSNTVSTASPYQLAQVGYYDNWEFRSWSVYMPTPGDANTFGGSQLFGGRIADTKIVRGQIQWSINSFLDVVNQVVPTNVIELLNTGAAYTGATPMPGFDGKIPNFNVVVGSSVDVIVGTMTTPVVGGFIDPDLARGGFLVFYNTPGSTLGGFWSPILQNVAVPVGGGSLLFNNQFVLSVPLPWPPTPGLDSFYVSGAAPINKEDGSYIGFPYVPANVAAL